MRFKACQVWPGPAVAWTYGALEDVQTAFNA
jgi:hypothetical protein